MGSHRKPTLDFGEKIDFSEILTNPILDIAARFWEKDRYEAFRICYRAMRRIDDLVDDHKAAPGGISYEDACRLRKVICDWLETFRRGNTDNPFAKELFQTLDTFKIPDQPWELLCRSMTFDIDHDSFPDFRIFLRYTEGAAVAPASIFMHLCGVTPNDERFNPPDYDIHDTARDLALFSYLVHIMRDFQKDQLRNLNYFANDLLAEQSLGVADLQLIAKGGPIGEPFRNLMRKYYNFAEQYRARAREVLDNLCPRLEPRYGLSLEIIYGLYLQIIERIDPASGSFTTEELNPKPDEIQSRIKAIVGKYNSS